MSIIIKSQGKRLSRSEYERPELTITETMQNKKDIEEQLKDFEEVSSEDLNFISINTQLKYISYDKKNKKELFRFGGLLMKIEKEYVVLAGKDGLRFSVQRYTRNDKSEIIHITRFFRKIKEIDMAKEHINQSQDYIKQQNDFIVQQKKEITDLKKQLKEVMKKK
jgi:hypothetical protein